jgi:tetratricopeptide (TPR) repeat protein
VGRDDLLASISRDWASPDRSVTGLIGFGGEGKSSLARRWVDNLLANVSPPPTLGEGPGVGARPDGVFWWGFYDRPSVDEFFEAALTYMGGEVMARRVRSANVRAQVIGAMLGAGRYLFVLDGLEIMQHQEGDQYGLLRSTDLREFLSYFAAPEHQSFCLVTSRAPLLDLMAYTTYTHRDVTRLSPADGVALLREVGVVGQDGVLSNVVEDWDGHALTLGLLGGYLAEQHGGDVAHIGEIPPPTADEPRYERVHRVLRRYDDHLTGAERAFLTLFSAFRTPVHESAFDKVFRPLLPSPTSPPTLGGTEGGLAEGGLDALVQRLVAYRILRHDPNADTYTTHPLIRNHYFARLTAGDRAQTQDAHERIKDYYLELAGDTPRFPTLDNLAPLIEVVHHACRAGAYDEAHRIRRERIYQDNRKVLIHQLGAYETTLALMQEFFPGGDASQEPQVGDPSAKSYILNAIGLYLMNLGRLGEAVPFYERAVAGIVAREDWHNASIGYQNLADLHAYLGALTESADAAREALALAHRAENKDDKCQSLAHQAWAAHLCGDLDAADAAFQQAEALEQPEGYLYSNRGIFHAEHLRLTGQADYARRVTEANLEICERNRWQDSISRSHRVLGDLGADPSTSSGQAGQHESARAHYDEALRIARGITACGKCSLRRCWRGGAGPQPSRRLGTCGRVTRPSAT